MEDKSIREAVKERFGRAAKQSSSCCGAKKSYYLDADAIQAVSKMAGYSDKELKSIPEGANLGLGCGNPVALASIKVGDVVLDLGSGAGVDCFLAANIVGDKGRVIGVDMTPEMIEKARENAKKGSHQNIEFRLGEIENLPIASNSIDAVISNCVINLSTDKQKVFREVYRVLKPGGKLMVSDVALLKELPVYINNSIEAYVRCIGGAMLKDDYINAIREARFQDVTVVSESHFPSELIVSRPVVKEVVDKLNISVDELQDIGSSVVSIKISARKAIF